MTETIKQFLEDNRKLFEIAKFQVKFHNAMCDLGLCPNRGKVAIIWTIGKKKEFQFLRL